MDTINDIFEFFTPLALLLLRLVVAFVFVFSVKDKLANVGKFAAKNGIPVWLAWPVVAVELFGAISLTAGIWPRWGALFLMGLMTGTMSMHIFRWKSPYWASKGGWEYDLMIFSSCAVIASVGGGSLALLS